MKCDLCNTDITDDFMVHNTVWKEAGLEPKAKLCFTCFHGMLPRPVRINDFRLVPANAMLFVGYGLRQAEVRLSRRSS